MNFTLIPYLLDSGIDVDVLANRNVLVPAGIILQSAVSTGRLVLHEGAELPCTLH
jgi:hypothetical protein